VKVVVQDSPLAGIASIDPLAAGDVNAVNTFRGQPGEKLLWVEPEVDRVCKQVMKIK
jgi:hypothetical protein